MSKALACEIPFVIPFAIVLPKHGMFMRTQTSLSSFIFRFKIMILDMMLLQHEKTLTSGKIPCSGCSAPDLYRVLLHK